MKRLKMLCSFLIGSFIGWGASFFILAVIGHKAKYVVLGITITFICGIILYNITKAEKEIEEN